jgi:hypothetical protein
VKAQALASSRIARKEWSRSWNPRRKSGQSSGTLRTKPTRSPRKRREGTTFGWSTGCTEFWTGFRKLGRPQRQGWLPTREAAEFSPKKAVHLLWKWRGLWHPQGREASEERIQREVRSWENLIAQSKATEQTTAVFRCTTSVWQNGAERPRR